jgi:RHS repeat-associated protein
MYKYIWAGDDRLAAQRDNGGNEELQRYFLHKDLQGSTNIVTDYQGNTFQHQEYFPTGEVWFSDNSTVFRTPFQYGGSYVDEVRALGNFGGRWYDQVREMMYSPDPVLADDPTAIVTTPSLRAAYAYAGSNSVTNVDPSGRQFTPAQRKAFIKANFQRARELVAQDPALRASLEANLKTRLPKSLVRLGLDIKSAELHQKRFEMIDDIAKPFVEINISTGEVQLSPGLFKQFTVRHGKAHTNNASTQSATGNQVGATNASGGPAVSGTGTDPTANSGASKGVPGPMRPTRPRRAAPPPPPTPPHGANSVKGSS